MKKNTPLRARHRALLLAGCAGVCWAAAFWATAAWAAPAAVAPASAKPLPSTPSPPLPAPASPAPAARPAPAATGEAPATIAFSELVRGQKGYGFSVFAGSEPERFEVEVIGVQEGNEIAGMDYLITRLSGAGLEKTGVAGGMSGSPVYFYGRLAGAVSFTYTFAREPIAGVTPIAAMRAIPNSAAATGTLPQVELPRRGGILPRVRLADLFDDKVDRAAFDQTLDLLAPGGGGGRSAMSFVASGFGPEVRRLLESRLGPLLAPAVATPMASPAAAGAGGSAAPAAGEAAARELAPGDSVAMVMVRGDLGIAAVGTVTDRVGDQVVAFGHKIFGGHGGLGPVRLPMATAEVLTVMPSLQDSFKLANVGGLVGSFLEDRGAGSRGMVGPIWPMTPFTVQVDPHDGGTPHTYHMEIASEGLFRGFMMVLSTVGAIAGSGHDQGGQSIDLEVVFHLKDHADVRGRHSFVGGQAAFEAAFQVMEYATYFAFNEFEPVEIESAEVHISQHEEERMTRVLDAWPDRRTVEPGEMLGFYVELEDYQGVRRRQRMEFPIPSDASGRFYLMIGDGRSADSAYAQVEKLQPKTLEQGLELLRRRRSNRDLYVLGLEGGPGILVGGRALPDLPGSQRALLGSAAESALPWRISGEKVIALDRSATGMVRIDLEVERRQSRVNTRK